MYGPSPKRDAAIFYFKCGLNWCLRIELNDITCYTILIMIFGKCIIVYMFYGKKYLNRQYINDRVILVILLVYNRLSQCVIVFFYYQMKLFFLGSVIPKEKCSHVTIIFFFFPVSSQDWKARLKIPPADTRYKTEVRSWNTIMLYLKLLVMYILHESHL